LRGSIGASPPRAQKIAPTLFFVGGKEFVTVHFSAFLKHDALFSTKESAFFEGMCAGTIFFSSKSALALFFLRRVHRHVCSVRGCD